MRPHDGRELRRDLGKWQIFMIVVSTTIGVGFFANSGDTLALAGPAATILAFAVVGLVAWGAMDGLSEMVVFWPVPNPLVQFVQTFVDRELGTVVHFAYWYTYAISTVAVITTAGDIVQYWSPDNNSDVSRALIFITFPIIILLINCSSVKVFGYIELLGGSLKLLIVVVLAFLMFLIDWGVGPYQANHSSCIKAGFQDRLALDRPNENTSIAAVLAISLAVFPYVGVETFTITAFEAKSPDALKLPSKRMAPFIMCLYTLSVLGFALNVPWTNGYLPAYYGSWSPDSDQRDLSCYGHRPRDLSQNDAPTTGGHVLPVIAIDLAGIKILSGLVNGCLLYSALSTANSSLFMASRILHSFTATHGEKSRFLSAFNRLNDQGSPVWAVCASLVFCWVPFLSFIRSDNSNEKSDSAKYIQQVLMHIGSTSCVLVWAAQCLAYIRYRKWLGKHWVQIAGTGYEKYYSRGSRKWTEFPSHLQPTLARVSGAMCIIIVLGFPIAGLFHGGRLKKLIAINTYLGPVLCLCLLLGLKGYRWRRAEKGWVRLGDWEELRRVIETLRDDSLSNARCGDHSDGDRPGENHPDEGHFDEDDAIRLSSLGSHQHLH